jgi:amino acid adenylation domain-containing protein
MVKNIALQEYTAVDFDPFAGPEIIAVAPATESQKEIMISCLLGGDAANRAFNESISVRFTGILHKEALEKALHDLTDRHEALHSAFSGDDKQICILTNSANHLDYKNISQFTTSQQEEIISDLAHSEALRVFDLLNGPLFQVRLLKLSENEHYLTIIAHHIICDGWSLNIILQELGKLYYSHIHNTFADLPDATPFSKYANEQQIFYESAEYKQIENYWVNQYKDNVPVLNLATDFPRPAARTYKSNRIDYKVTPDLTADLKKLSIRAGCTFVTTLIASFEVFLHRFTGQETFALGLPAAGQAATGNYHLAGHCVNLLPLKIIINTKSNFQEYLKERKKTILDSFEHQQFSFGSLLKKLNIARDASRVALVPVVFNVDMGMNDGVNFYGLQHELISNPREFETFELFLNISGSEKSLTFEWSYNTQLFKAETINRMMEGFSKVLKKVTEDPFITIENIPLTDTKNLLEKLSEWNATEAPYDKEIPVHQLIAKAAAKFPGNTALIFKDKKISYKTLHETANQLAHYLIEKGIKTGDVVGVALDRSPKMIISLLAVMKSGAAYVPLDPEYPADRIQYMLEDSSAKLLISSEKYKGKLTSDVIEFIIEDEMSDVLQLSKSAPDVPVSGNDLAYILYTSGSTGKPKGVLVEHHNLVNLLLSMVSMPGINEQDILLAVTTVSFDIAGLEMFLPLITGATILLADEQMAKDGSELLKIVKEQHVTMMQATPATYKMMLAAGWEQLLNVKILCCGEPMTKDLADKLCTRCTTLYNMYGPTETAIYSTGKKITIVDEIITIGRPINNTQVYILDESLSPVAEGNAGEIFIAGHGVARGYVNLPLLTAEKFIPNPFAKSGSEKMYRTGDLGKFVSNGEIQCLGRIDRQIKIRGYRIEPGEIENAIMKYAGFKETLVSAFPDKKLHQQLTAFIVPVTRVDEEQFRVISSKLKESLKETLPAYMVPAHFIQLEQLPLLLNGKIDYKALSEIYLNNNEPAGNKPLIPFTKTEKLLSDIWSEFLSSENIDLNDNFFELGGHSLIAVEVMMRIEKETGKKLPLSTLFEYPTIKKLASLLESEKKEKTYKSLVPIKPSGSKMPVYIIHGSGLNILNFKGIALHVDEEQPVYGLQAKGLDGSDEILSKMEEIAAYYISQVLEHNPDGPYAIAGYSFGGYVGIEMARQLRLMGKEVKMLAMFDTNAETQNEDRNTIQKASAKVTRQFKKLSWISSSLVKRPEATVRYQLKFVYNTIKSAAARFGLVAKKEPEGYLLEIKRIGEQHDIAYNNYRLQPFDGTIDLFKAKTRVYFVEDPKFLGWKKIALKGVRVHEVPGDHKTMLLSPNDKEFARTLQNALDNC